ncbi:MAG: L-2-amino-thiazoline-4-carboxylic acid hydrolase [bacterium]|nr:L-2-amino-thiazoline-4-carboxylic acid hydrolase [bacterium]
MDHSSSRRCFLQIAAVSSGALCLGVPFAGAEASPEERSKLSEQLSIEFQKRQAHERIVLFEKLVAKYGEEIIRDVEDNTIGEARKRFEEPRFTDRGLTGVKAYLWDQMSEGFEFTVVEDTPQKLEYRVSACFLADTVGEHDRPDLGHAFYCAWDEGFCQGLNPRIRFTRSKTLMNGDECCNHTYELIKVKT